MRQTIVYRGERGWFWELRIDARVVIFGWSETYDGAQTNARMA